jgi:hypothetical protein
MPALRSNSPLGQVIVGLPSPYVETWIKPTAAGNYRAT